jgi:hypothetical protein
MLCPKCERLVPERALKCVHCRASLRSRDDLPVKLPGTALYSPISAPLFLQKQGWVFHYPRKVAYSSIVVLVVLALVYLIVSGGHVPTIGAEGKSSPSTNKVADSANITILPTANYTAIAATETANRAIAPSLTPAAALTATPPKKTSDFGLSTLFNNIGIGGDQSSAVGNFDHKWHSYSQSLLSSCGLTPGSVIVINSIYFQWPKYGNGISDNMVLDKQTLAINTQGKVLGILGAASNGNHETTIQITYADGSTSELSLGFSDWTLNNGNESAAYNNIIIAALPYFNGKQGRQTSSSYVFFASLSLDTTRIISSITFGKDKDLHIFSVGLK